MNDQLQRIGAVIASHVDMLKGFMGDQFAVSVIARHKHGPFHLLLGDDAELALIQTLSELLRVGKVIVRDGAVDDDPEPSIADHMVNLLQECAEHLRGNTIQSTEVNAELAGRIEQVLDVVVPERKDMSPEAIQGRYDRLASIVDSCDCRDGEHVDDCHNHPDRQLTEVQPDPLRHLEPPIGDMADAPAVDGKPE